MAIIKLKGYPLSEWTGAKGDPVLADREVALITDTGEQVVGDGATVLSLLPRTSLDDTVITDRLDVVEVGTAAYGTSSSSVTSGGEVSAGAGMASAVTAASGWVVPAAATVDARRFPFGVAATSVTHSTAHGTNARRDLVVARVTDTVSGTVAVEVVTGTPAASPVDPAIPANSVLLGRVTVPAGAVAATSFTYTDLREFAGFDPVRFGPVGLGDDTAAVQGALDAAATVRGTVDLDARIWDVSGVTIPAGVTLAGAGHGSTVLRLIDGANSDVIRSEGFATFTGSGLGKASEGVPDSFAVLDLTIDGNKTNNTSGRGIAFYGRRYVLDRVFITQCAGHGFYSEFGDLQPFEDDDANQIEAHIGTLWVRRSGGDGVHFLGPNDTHFGQVFTAVNAGRGFFNDFDAAPYRSGTFDAELIHSYANTGVGIELHAQARIVMAQPESNYAGGLIVKADGTQIDRLYAYSNLRDYEVGRNAPITAADCDVQADWVTITQAQIIAANAGTALRWTGKNGHGGVSIDGQATAGLGVDFDGDRVRIDGQVRGFSATGGIGVRVAASLARADIAGDLRVTDCKLGVERVNAVTRPSVAFSIAASTGQTDQSGLSGLGYSGGFARWYSTGAGTLNPNRTVLPGVVQAPGGIEFGPDTFPGVYSGAGSPEGVVTGRIGSLYLRNNGGAGTCLYVKESGNGNTGWVAK